MTSSRRNERKEPEVSEKEPRRERGAMSSILWMLVVVAVLAGMAKEAPNIWRYLKAQGM